MTTTVSVGRTFACWLLACALVPAAWAQPPGPSWFDPTVIDASPVAPAVRTHHSGTFAGKPVTYDALAGERVLAGADGDPAATIFSTAYVRTGVADAATRPVVFVFNGGPGASSSPLHLGIGPMRRSPDDAQSPLVPNPSSPLDAVDLVFIDPVGTGYTRLFREGAGTNFWSVEKDADSILLLIRDWLAEQGRSDSPAFLMGESYGGTRAVTMLARARDVIFAGALLLSPALDFTAMTPITGNNLPYIFLLPSMAATAAYHGVTDRAGRSLNQVFDDAAVYAQSDFAAALYQGNALGEEQKIEAAARVSTLIGLPQTYVLAHNLRIARADFWDELLADKGLRVGGLDARDTGPKADYEGKRPPTNDPSMVSSRNEGRSTGELLDEYFKGQLGVDIARPYRSLNLDANSHWEYGGKDQRMFYFSVAPLLQQAMKEQPALRVFIGGGMFDLGTPVMASRYTVQQLDVPPARFTLESFEAGHTVFEHEESRVRLAQDMREFTAAALNDAAASEGSRP